MKCKQCGWDNPDNRERCEKCNNLLAKQRPVDSSMPVYDNDRTVIDHTADIYRYGQAPVAPQQEYGMNTPHQPYGASPSQPYAGYNRHEAYMPQQNPYAPQQNPYAAAPMPAAAPHTASGEAERYCPECDAELPDGATECPVCHTRIEMEVISVVEGICPDCGTEVTPTQNYCHNCGTSLNTRRAPAPEPAPAPAPVRKPGPQLDKPADIISLDKPGEAPQPVAAAEEETVAAGPLAQDVPECRLQMLAADGSECDCAAVACVGTEVDLYRGNTDPANNTIARDLQARLTYADGKWSLEDCSALRTTYIRPGRSIELRDGDVIVMGNREFIFKS